MLGQGRPNTLVEFARSITAGYQRFWQSFRRPMLLRRGLSAALIWLFCFAAARAEPTMQLRFAWGGGAKKQWQGTIAIDNGKLSLARLLSEEQDAPGSIWEEHGHIEIHQPAARFAEAIDIGIAAPADAKLSIELQDVGAPKAAPFVLEIPLRDLISKPVNRELDRTNNRIRVYRTASDSLLLKPHHDHLVFSPGEKLKLDVEPRFLPVAPGASLQLRGRLISTAAGQESNIQEQAIKATAEGSDPTSISWEFNLPNAEGVYDFVVEAIEQSAWRIPKSRQIAERHMQLVVIDDKPFQPAADANVPWLRVMEIDPANPAWYERFRSWSLKNLRPGPLGNGGMQPWQHPTLGSLSRLKEHHQDQEPFWEAYPLTISRPGLPHVLEVEYPSDVPQTLGISIVEPNAAGLVTPVGLDSGVFVVDESATGAAARMLRHHVIFWPRTSAPMVLITNRGVATAAVYGKIRLLTGPIKLPPLFPVAEPSERLLAGYMGRPLLAENFGAMESLDLASGRSQKDWRTFHAGATRLAEYLQHVGYNGQMLTVMAEGSTIYPSRHLQSTLVYDNGELFETGQDPLRKDVLEMTLRIFDREGIKLIPSLRFDAPLPELEERLRRGGADAEGILLIGADGREYADASRPLGSKTPRYNPLNPHVQEAMLSVVRELAERYSKHPSFAGIAIELSAESSTQLPGEAWSLDDDTLARFEKATNIKVPGEGTGRFAERAQKLAPPLVEHTQQKLEPPPRTRFAAGVEHTEWLKWRAQVLADFYRRMQTELTTARRDAVLYLAASNLFDGHESQEWLRPSLPPKASANEVLSTMGLKPDLLQHDRGLVFLRPQRLLPPGPVADQAVLATVNQATELDTAFGRLPAAGSLLLSDPRLRYDTRQLHLTSFEQKSPFGKDKTNLVLYPHFLPAERHNRERFIHALATLDAEAIFDGGWLLPMGQEESFVDLVAAYRRLPAGKFDLHPDSTLPVTIRSQQAGNSTYSYLVNDSAWPLTVDLKMTVPPGTRVDELTGRRRLPALNADHWQLQLEPFDFLAMRFWSPNVNITKAQLLPNPQMQTFLSRRNQDFKLRLNTLDSPPSLNVPTNAFFELPLTGGQIPGWSLLNRATGAISLAPEGDPNRKPAGKQALLFRGSGQSASLRSEWFAMPPSRRATIKLWMKLPDASKSPTAQLVVEDDRGFRITGPVAFNGPGAIPGEWNWFIYQLTEKNLPDDGTSRLRFGLDLTGPGEVLVDNVQIFDLIYAPEELVQLNKIVVNTNGYLGERKLGECLYDLDRYWPRFIISYVPLPAVAQLPNQANALPGKEEEKTRSARPFEKLFKGRY